MPGPKVLVLQHAEPEHLGIIEPALRGRGLDPIYVRTFRGETVPRDLHGTAGLIVLGGPMGVYEQAQHAHLASEIVLIEEALRTGTPLLGVCLGSQLLASVLGAPVAPGTAKEIGWHGVTLAPAAAQDPLLAGLPPSFEGFHWHGDVFPLPQGAVALASSAMTGCQAFRHASTAWGLLFHLEVTAAMVEAMSTTFADELAEVGIAKGAIVADLPGRIARLNAIGATVFGRWADLVATRTRPW